MVGQSSRRTLAQPTRPASPARSFNERSHGLMRKIHTLSTSLSDFGVEIALLIKTPHDEFTYEPRDGMLRNFTTHLPEENRFRPQDVENLFRGRILACSYINYMPPLRDDSGRSSPTPSTSSAASASSVPLPAATGLSFPTLPPTHPPGPGTSPISVSPLPTAETEPTLAASPSPSQSVSLSFPNTGSSPTLMPDLLNSDPWLVDSDVPLSFSPGQDQTTHRPLPSSRPTRATTPTPSASSRSRLQSPYRVLKISTPQSRRKWFD